MRSTIDDAFAHFGPTYDCTIFQSTLGQQHGHVLYSDANRTYVTYSTLHTANLKGGSEAQFIGNAFESNVGKGLPGIYFDGVNSDLIIRNNRFNSGNNSTSIGAGSVKRDNYEFRRIILNENSSTVSHIIGDGYTANNAYGVRTYYDAVTKMVFYYFDGSISARGGNTRNSETLANYSNPFPEKHIVSVEFELRAGSEKRAYIYPACKIANANRVLILNNMFHDWAKRAHDIEVVNAPVGGLIIQGNSFYKSAVSSDFSSVQAPQRNGNLCTHNYFSRANRAVGGGIAHFDNLLGGDPGFVDYAGNDFRLGNSSPLSDQGPADPEFNDLDGSRNDLGMYGGHAYDPNGSTSILPVVIASQQSIYRMNVGDSTPIVIKARAAVSTPKQN
jgi:hypothetical protein